MNTAVLFLVFNRPDTTREVFASIRRIKPPRLYVAADGPRESREHEAEQVKRVRQIATSIDWPCELTTLFRDENLGCKAAISEAISWFFEHEEEGVILEDDCLADDEFFHFCEQMLDRYRDDQRVWMITGNNFQGENWRGEAAYYFSRYSHIWGWASWRRAWQHYDGDLSFWPGWKESDAWKSVCPDAGERRYWSRAFSRSYESRVDSWAYPWMASVWHGSGLTVTPNRNLVTNIGFGTEATHTRSANARLLVPLAPLGQITHPAEVSACAEADAYVFKHVFSDTFLELLLRAPSALWAYIVGRLK